MEKPSGAQSHGPVAATSRAVNRAWQTRVKAIGPGVVSASADTDPTTVATLIVVGSTTGYIFAWLTVLLLPMLAVVQTLATRVGVLSGRGLQTAVVDGYGRGWAWLLMVSVVAVNIVTIAADLSAGAAAVGLLTGLASRWWVPIVAAVLLGLLYIGGYDEVERVLKYVLLSLVGYLVAAVLARPHLGALAHGTFVPSLRPDRDHIAGALALLGTTLTSYMYLWQTVEQAEEGGDPARLAARKFDAWVGSGFAVVLFWSILTASAATLGAQNQRVETAEQAAQALRPLAGPWAGVLFAIGLLASAIVAVPVITASTGYVVAATFHWNRGLSRSVRQAPAFYVILTVATVLGTVLAMVGIGPIRLLFIASVIGGLATPIGLALLTLVAGNPALTGRQPASRQLRIAGWAVTALLTVVSGAFLVEQFRS